MEYEYKNIIGGREISLSGKYFYSESPFYEGYKIRIADSGKLDIALATSKIISAERSCSMMNFDAREDILKEASEKIKFGREYIEHAIKMSGMPYKYVKKYIDEIPLILKMIPALIRQKYGVSEGRIVRPLYSGSKKYELRVPAKGFVYGITPGNDPRISALVSAVLVSIGMSGILKVSKNDVPIAREVVNAIINCGYPADGLALVSFDTSRPEARALNFEIIDKAGSILAFGDDKTVDNMLRFETKNMLDLSAFMQIHNIPDTASQFDTFAREIIKYPAEIGKFVINHKIDHFSDKIILRHGSGRCAGIVDKGFGAQEAADILISSSMHYPIGCNSMKSAFIVNEMYGELESTLIEKIKKLDKKTGDPLKPATEVGYIAPELLKKLMKRIEELKRIGLVKLLSEVDVKNDYQTTPILAATKDTHSELLINEYSAYILGIKSSHTFESAVEEVNDAAKGQKKLAVSVLTHNPAHSRAKIHAHHIKINELTTDIDGIVHEGNDYISHLTQPCIITRK